MSQVELLNQTLTLQRFPPMPEETPLQAWEAADEYLLRMFARSASTIRSSPTRPRATTCA